jgi:hypothetical protein
MSIEKDPYLDYVSQIKLGDDTTMAQYSNSFNIDYSQYGQLTFIIDIFFK